MTDWERDEVYLRCYVCGGMERPSFWADHDAEAYTQIAFCNSCADDLGIDDIHDLPMVPLPYMELFDDEKPQYLTEIT